MRARTFIFILAGSLLAAGCTVGPNYVKPKLSMKPGFAEINSSMVTNPPPAEWWKTFNDPELDKLINEALQTNYDLQIAYSRVRQSRFQRNIVAADLFPQVDADGGYLHGRGSKNVVLPLGGSSGSSGSSSSGGSSASTASGGGGSGSSSGHSVKFARVMSKDAQPNSSAQSQSSSSSQADPPSQSGSQASAQNDAAFDNQLTPFGKGGLPGTATDLYQVGFDANWEIDVFGSKRRQVQAATADIAAAEENRRQLALTVIAEVARDYFDLRGMQERLEIARQNLAAQSNILELTRSRVRSGLAPDVDAVRAQAEVETTGSTIPPLVAETRTVQPCAFDFGRPGTAGIER